MTLLDHKKIVTELSRCVQCGICLSRCPVYLQDRDEKESARGKVALLNQVNNNRQKLSEQLEQVAEKCLYCLNCQSVCPQHIELDILVPYLRSLTGVRTLTQKHVRNLLEPKLAKPEFIQLLATNARRFQAILARNVPENRGIRLRFPLPGLPTSRLLPRLARRPFVSTAAQEYKGKSGKPRVGLFLGCLHNYLDTRSGQAMLDLLQRLHFNVVIPSGQGCCGLPHFSSGLIEAAEELAYNNIRAFQEADCDYIVSGCPTCVAMLSKQYEHLGKQNNPFQHKTSDITSLLSDHGPEISALLASCPGNEWYTYHDPCHLAGELGIRNQPRVLLKLLAGTQFQEMAQPDTCCGGGGSFSIKQYDLSLQIGAVKMKHVLDWHARIQAAQGTSSPAQKFFLVTACPGCEIQLNDLLMRQGSDIKVVHLVDVLARHLVNEETLVSSHFEGPGEDMDSISRNR